MPRVKWGKGAPSKKDIDNYDRSGQRYIGPTPPNGAYRAAIKLLKVVQDKGKKDHLRVGLELVPRNSSEKRYKGYFIVDFLYNVKGAEFKIAPFCDALGVSADDFLSKVVTDEDGNVLKIGKWVKKNASDIVYGLADNTGEQSDKYPKQVNGYAPLTEDSEVDDDDDEDDDDEWDDEDESDEDENDDDDDDDEDEDEDEPPRKKSKKTSKKRR